MPLLPVSVVLPVRNGANTVGLAVGDLIKGMSPDDELLVVNDGSGDETSQILSGWEERDSRVRVLTTAGIGLVGALNLGIDEAAHDWIARADADDRYPIDRLQSQKAAVIEGVALVTGDYILSPPSGRSTYLPCALGHPFVALSLINPQRIPHPGVVIHRDAVQFAGGYRVEDFPAEDLGLWLRLSETGKFVGVATCVVDWAMAPGSVTHTRQVEQRTRTSELLAGYRPGFLRDVTDTAVREELARYEISSHPRERAVLLARDYQVWRKRGVSPGGLYEVLMGLGRHPVASAGAVWRLGQDTRSRRRGRTLVSGGT